MRSRMLRGCLVAVAVSIGLPAALAQSEGVAWRTDLAAAKAEASQTGKLVLAHFWTETCGPCKALETRVFSQPPVAMALAGEFVPVKINAHEAADAAQAYGVTRVPTDVILTADGQAVHAFVSPATPMEYVGLVRQVAAAYKTRSGAPYDAIAAGAPVTAANRQPAFGSQPLPPQSESSRAAPSAAPPVGTRYQPAPTVAANPYTASSPAPTATPAVQQVATSKPPTRQAAAPQLPAGSPPLGFDGFCPVTMKQHWRWERGDVRFGAIHGGRTYLFCTADAQRAFLADPDSYSPVLSGSDPVAAIEQSRSVPGTREFAVEYEGRFYLFSSEQSLEKFWTNPAAYANGVQRIASAPGGGPVVR